MNLKRIFMLATVADWGKCQAITPPSNESSWQLTQGETGEPTSVLHIEATTGTWQIEASDTNPITSGHMTEWTGSSYGSQKLINATRIRAASEVSLPEGGVIQTGSKTKGQGEDVNVTFLQEGSFADAPVTPDHEYRIVITFVASHV